jgi:hypothetical protein
MNEFEKYPDLAKWMEHFASISMPGVSMQDWDEFCSAINNALVDAWQKGATRPRAGVGGFTSF